MSSAAYRDYSISRHINNYFKTPISGHEYAISEENMRYNKSHKPQSHCWVLRSKVYAFLIENKLAENSWKETRLLLYYLLYLSANLNHKQYIDDFNSSDTLEQLAEYLVKR